MNPDRGPPPRNAAAEATLAGVTPVLTGSPSQARDTVKPANLQQQHGLRVIDGGRLDWSSQQCEALDQIDQWLRQWPGRPFYLGGYAGTGKTTLAREIARRADGHVVFGFTGKAAEVMREKGCDDADTLDALIYSPEIETTCAARPPCASICIERCRHRRERMVGKILTEKSCVAGADLVIVDEVSMVDEPMGRDLLSFGAPVLVLGDPAQLPPVRGEGHFTARDPDYLLTEVHRQALGSPIITMATQVRSGVPPRHPGAVVRDIAIGEAVEFDQIIVGRNATRQRLNQMCRAALGFTSPLPMPGEKVVCLKNDRRLDIRNGTLWTIVEVGPEYRGFIDMTVANEAGQLTKVTAPIDGFTSTNGAGNDLPGNPFAWGYALTCHKAQGSQWDSVLVFDESRCFREDRWRWLYTAITRAAKRIVVVRHDRRAVCPDRDDQAGDRGARRRDSRPARYRLARERTHHVSLSGSRRQEPELALGRADPARRTAPACSRRARAFSMSSMKMRGLADFEAAKIEVAELLRRDDLIKTKNGSAGQFQKTDAYSLLNAPAERRDDSLPLKYLAHRLGVPIEEVPVPSTPIVGLKALGYFDPPPQGSKAKPKHVGDYPCAVFGTVAADGRNHAHRIYVAPGGAGKADLGEVNGHPRDPKKSARIIGDGSIAGCSVLWGETDRAGHRRHGGDRDRRRRRARRQGTRSTPARSWSPPRSRPAASRRSRRTRRQRASRSPPTATRRPRETEGRARAPARRRRAPSR